MKVKKYEQFFDPSFSENTYLVSNRDECFLVDPGMLGPELKEELANYKLQFIVLTHGHSDHFLGIDELDVPIYISKDDLRLVRNPEYSYATYMNSTKTYQNKDFRDINDLPNFSGEKFKVFYTPGHTKGSVCIQILDRMFTGDTLFINTIGRTDLFSGSMNEMTRTLKELKQKISNNTIIYPGHGGYAKFKKVLEMNPYLK